MKILYDVTEPQRLVETLTSLCAKHGISAQRCELRKHDDAKPETLKANPYLGSGVDYIILNAEKKALLGIERKSLKDCVLSIIQKEEKTAPTGAVRRSGHIFRQLDNLSRFPNRILILEGYLLSKYSRFENHVYGLEFWCYRNQIGVIHTSGMESSAKAISVLARKALFG